MCHANDTLAQAPTGINNHDQHDSAARTAPAKADVSAACEQSSRPPVCAQTGGNPAGSAAGRTKSRSGRICHLVASTLTDFVRLFGRCGAGCRALCGPALACGCFQRICCRVHHRSCRHGGCKSFTGGEHAQLTPGIERLTCWTPNQHLKQRVFRRPGRSGTLTCCGRSIAPIPTTRTSSNS